MKYKVSELEGPLLDAAVAKAEGMEGRIVAATSTVREHFEAAEREGIVDEFEPSRYWTDGGPIIERERIETVCNEWLSGYELPLQLWSASYDVLGVGEHFMGPTPLIAAMRAYVASKFGEEVELP